MNNTYIKITHVETNTFAMELKNVTPKPGVDALEVVRGIGMVLPPDINITAAEFITREEYERDYGEETADDES